MIDIEKYRKTLLIATAVLYALMIGIGSIPNEADKLGTFFPDYVLHFTAYGILAAMIALGLGPRHTARALKVLVLIALMGALDEAIQSTLSYRTADIRDWMVDMYAALSVAAVCTIASVRTRMQRPQ